ncbi:MAG: PadR family transcriptional regulator [Nocardioidaceae bacterium]
MGHGHWDQPWDNPHSRHGRRPPWGGGPPPWVQGLIGLAHSGGGGAMRAGPRVRRGDVRSAILDVLAAEPMNGYQIIQQIAERTGGTWKPSPGSVYPTVQQLEDEGLVEGHEAAGRRVLHLSEAGQAYAAEHADEIAATWRVFDEAAEQERDGDGTDLRQVIGQVMGGVWQVVTSGTRQQQAETAEILADARRKIYNLLAEGDQP